MNSTHIAALFALVTCLSSGCATSRWYDARYMPAPWEEEVRSQGVPGSQVRALVSVLGIARPDEKAGRPKQVEMRMRLENLGTVPARLDESDLSLLSSDLVPFERPKLEPRDDLTIPPGQARQFDVAFPVPDKKIDWDGLTLRFSLLFNDMRVTLSSRFTRLMYAPADPVRWHVGVGYGYRW